VTQNRSVPISAGETRTENVEVPLYVAPTSLSLPGVSPSRPTHGKTATFTARLTSAAGTPPGASSLFLYRWESKLVRKKVKGKWKKVKVYSWRLRSTRTMTASADGSLRATYKLPYSGKWKMIVKYSGPANYAPSATEKTFTAK
jgi:hypothetical protein